MNFTPKSEKEIAEANLFPKGNYPAEVRSAENAISKSSGNEMIKIKVAVMGENGRTIILTDYLMPQMEAKLRHFCECAGILKKYESGELEAEDCVNRAVIVKLAIEEDKTGKYDPKNTIRDYVPERKQKAAVALATTPAGKDPIFDAKDEDGIPDL